MNSEEKVLVFDLSTEGLEPVKHRIIGITCKTASEEKIFADRNEKKILTAFWEYIKSQQFNRIVGFNSVEFDVPMLNIRSMKNHVNVVQIELIHIDMRKVIFNGRENKKGTLKEFGELLNVKLDDHGYGKMHMSLLWERPDLMNLRECLLGDVRITWALYEHAKEVQLI